MNLVKTSRILDCYFPYDVSNIILSLLPTECEYANNVIKEMVDYYYGYCDKVLPKDTSEYLYSCSYDDFVRFFETMKKVYHKSFDIAIIFNWYSFCNFFKNKDFVLTINKLRYLYNNFDFPSSEMMECIDWDVFYEIYDCLGYRCELKNKDIPILYLYYLDQQRKLK